MDISAAGLQRSRDRLGDRAKLVRWISADITDSDPGGPFEVWHDRAVFHFLTSPEERAAYAIRLRSALAEGGTAIIAAFGPQGPTHCSGLPVRRYDSDGLLGELGTGFRLERDEITMHETPSGGKQQFVYGSFRFMSPAVPTRR